MSLLLVLMVQIFGLAHSDSSIIETVPYIEPYDGVLDQNNLISRHFDLDSEYIHLSEKPGFVFMISLAFKPG